MLFALAAVVVAHIAAPRGRLAPVAPRQVRLRRVNAEPLPTVADHSEVAPQTGQPGAAGLAVSATCVPVEVLTEAKRQ
jgi:hypothetical protein